MTAQVRVLSIQALRDLEALLGRFAAEAHDAMTTAEAEIRRTLEWLERRVQHWRREVERRQRGVEQAAAALERCRRSGYVDQDGHYHAPDCSAYAAALLTARSRLEHARAELANAERWQARVLKAEAAYRVQARRLDRITTVDIPRARALLTSAVTDLEAYLAVRGFEVALQAARALGPAAGAAVGGLIHMLDSPRRVWSRVSGSMGEDIAAQVVASLGLKEVPFDPPKHGFDRVFSAPGIPVIIVESKVASGGRLRLGSPKAGQQMGPEWIASTERKMADPTSAQWSPANERIARLVEELGPENVPALTVVINPTIRTADVYYRQAGPEAWSLFEGGISLDDIAGAPPASGAGPEAGD